MSDGGPDPVPIGDALDGVLRGFGAPKASVLASLVERWDEVAGSPLAGHARPLAVEGGTLAIGVDDALFAAEARWREREVVDRCDALLGPGIVTRIEVRVRPPGSA
jgi:hypothetical protein